MAGKQLPKKPNNEQMERFLNLPTQHHYSGKAKTF